MYIYIYNVKFSLMYTAKNVITNMTNNVILSCTRQRSILIITKNFINNMEFGEVLNVIFNFNLYYTFYTFYV